MTTDQVRQLAMQAAQALNRGAIPELESLSKQILQIDQGYADAWFFLSVAATERRKIGVASELIDNAVRINSNNTEYLAQKARLHTMAGERDKALATAEAALARNPESPVVIDTLGVVFSRFEQHERAREVLARGVEIAPGNAQFHFNLASVEQFLGHADAAEQEYREAVRLKPDFYRAYWALSELEKNAGGSDRLAVLKEHAARGDLSAEDQLYLGHSLSREYEKAGDYDGAFSALVKGKQRMAEKTGYTIDTDRTLFDALKEAFPAGAAYPAGELGDHNIFVLGMPRTGTTLVDRVLNAHSCIVSMGEVQDFARAVKKVSGSTSAAMLDTAIVQATGSLNMPEAGRQYLYTTGSKTDLRQWSLDKMPLNFLYIGYILRALPGARIICLRRHPLDTILSNYRQLFAVNFSYYNYHYRLEDTARYYALFDDLMRHWAGVFGDRILEVQYESLVAEPEPVVRSLCDYVGVAFEQSCLEFYRSREAVSTASTMQVRQPLYSSAVDRWRRYGAHLQPAIDVLEENGIAI